MKLVCIFKPVRPNQSLITKIFSFNETLKEWLFNVTAYASTLEIQQATDAFKNVNTVSNKNDRSSAHNATKFTVKPLRQTPVLAGVQ